MDSFLAKEHACPGMRHFVLSSFIEYSDCHRVTEEATVRLWKPTLFGQGCKSDGPTTSGDKLGDINLLDKVQGD